MLYSLWAKAHAEAGQVSVTEGKDDHEDDVPGVVSEHHGHVVPGLHVTQDEERHENDACNHQDGQRNAVFPRLEGHRRQKKDTIVITILLQSRQKTQTMSGLDNDLIVCLDLGMLQNSVKDTCVWLYSAQMSLEQLDCEGGDFELASDNGAHIIELLGNKTPLTYSTFPNTIKTWPFSAADITTSRTAPSLRVPKDPRASLASHGLIQGRSNPTKSSPPPPPKLILLIRFISQSAEGSTWVIREMQ